MLRKTLLALAAFVGSVIAAPALAGIDTAAPAQLQTRIIEGVGWTVKNFTRVCDGYPLECIYSWTISPGGYSPDAVCGFGDYDLPDNPVYASWSDAPCNTYPGNPWIISWGYNKQYDFAVMTIVNEVEQEDAWFGFNSVSVTTDFGDVGPSPVYALGTFT